LNLVNNKGECLLHNAVFYKNSLIVQWLLENGAEPNILGEKGDTPLYRATLQDQVDIVNQLLKVHSRAVFFAFSRFPSADIVLPVWCKSVADAAGP
jgi:ankyrin repeat protein